MNRSRQADRPRLSAGDLLSAARRGLLVRPLRVALSGLGIAIGIASMITVVGISESAAADLDVALSKMGTNLLTVSAGRTALGEQATLPADSPAMVARIGPVQTVTATGRVPGAGVYRTDQIPATRGGGIVVLAAQLNLPATLGAELADGAWLNAATARYPATVLGAAAARSLGIDTAGHPIEILVGRRWFSVVGILRPVQLAPEVDNAVLVGWPVAERLLGFAGLPTQIYERSDPHSVDAVREVLARTVNAEDPSTVAVSRPSDALVAQLAARRAFTGLLVGIGGVALLVGAIGVTNTMVISVLERRSEIGLRRALGATRRLIFAQFVTEALLLAGFGGISGVVLGAVTTSAYVSSRGWPVVLRPEVLVAAFLAAAAIGALAGTWPAARAARMAPTEALRSP
jgi:putative ABC transport system permease protein